MMPLPGQWSPPECAMATTSGRSRNALALASAQGMSSDVGEPLASFSLGGVRETWQEQAYFCNEFEFRAEIVLVQGNPSHWLLWEGASWRGVTFIIRGGTQTASWDRSSTGSRTPSQIPTTSSTTVVCRPLGRRMCRSVSGSTCGMMTWTLSSWSLI